PAYTPSSGTPRLARSASFLLQEAMLRDFGSQAGGVRSCGERIVAETRRYGRFATQGANGEILGFTLCWIARPDPISGYEVCGSDVGGSAARVCRAIIRSSSVGLTRTVHRRSGRTTGSSWDRFR